MRRFYKVETVIASETQQSIEYMDRHTALAMTEDDFDDDEEEYEKEWCD